MTSLIKKIAGLTAMLVLVVGYTMAQTQKIGTINRLELLNIMPATKGVNTKLSLLSDSLATTEYKKAVTDFETKAKAFQAGAKDWSETRREVEAKELGNMETTLVTYEQQMNYIIGQRRDILMQPVAEAAQKVLDSVAKENNISLVIDTASGAVLYIDDKIDLIPLVKAKLGVN